MKVQWYHFPETEPEAATMYWMYAPWYGWVGPEVYGPLFSHGKFDKTLSFWWAKCIPPSPPIQEQLDAFPQRA